MYRALLLVVLLSLGGCGILDRKPSLDVVGDSAKVQQATASSAAQADEIGEVVTINETINEDGLDPWMWLLIGMLLPMPKFMKVIF